MGTENQKKLQALFSFLQKLVTIKSHIISDVKDQPWHLFLDELPINSEFIQRYGPNDSLETEDGSHILLSVKNPLFHPSACPPYPKILEGWIDNNQADNIRIQQVSPTLEKESSPHTPVAAAANSATERFDDDPVRVSAYKGWTEQRNIWRAAEIQLQKTQGLFDLLYEKYNELKADSENYDLVIGNGMFFSTQPSVNHPIFLKKVSLLFHKDTMQLVETESSVEVYHDVFNKLENIERENLRVLSNSVTETEYHPFSQSIDDTFWKDSVSYISTKCRLAINKDDILPTDLYRLYPRSVLIIRKKHTDLAGTIDEIKEHIQENDDIPAPLSSIVFPSKTNRQSVDITSSDHHDIARIYGEDPNILLTKPANEEQLAIARAIENVPALVVQGPPGTGKTHTIANLLGHFLAQGNHVLVTSYTPKALNVLKDKLPKNIQSLCISLTDSSRTDMEKSVQGICEYVSNHDEEELHNTVERLKKRREVLLDELQKKRLLLTKIRRMERDSSIFSLGGTAYSLSQMACSVHECPNAKELIPGEVKCGHVFPISHEDLTTLYWTNHIFSEQREREMVETMPSLDRIASPSDFSKIVDIKHKLEENIHSLSLQLGTQCKQDGIWKDNICICSHLNYDIFSELKHQQNQLCIPANTIQKRAICIGWCEGGYRILWEQLGERIEGLSALRRNDIEYTHRKNIVFPKDYEEDSSVLSTLDELGDALAGNGKMFFSLQKRLHKDWTKVLSAVSIDNADIKSKQDCDLVKVHLRFMQCYRAVQKDWDSLFTEHGEPNFESLGDNMDDIISRATSRWQQTKIFLDWYYETYKKSISTMENAGIAVSAIFDENAFETDNEKLDGILAYLSKLPEYLALCEHHFINLPKVQEKIRKISVPIREYRSPISDALIEAIEAFDNKAYNQCYKRLIDNWNDLPLFQKRQELLEVLRKNAPTWADAIAKREGIHGDDQVPDGIENAWLCRQFMFQIDEARKLDMEELIQEISVLTDKLRSCTEEYAEKAAWHHLLRENKNTNLKSNLKAWEKTMKKIGKGTSSNKAKLAELRKQAKSLMREVQPSVPAWIMPLNKVWTNLRADSPKYDIIIIDEASQADITALPLLYFGKKVIVVGDEEQVSPSGIGVRDDELKKLQEDTIKGLIENELLYTAETSLYDIAQMAFETKMLKEHFRCVPEIIGYSNKLSYKNQIQPLRESSTSGLQPMISYQVEGKKTNQKENLEEAEHIAALMSACIDQPEYKNKTFGAITLLGSEQATIISQAVRKNIKPAVLEEHDFLCGNAAQFQGDERDIIFISLVDDKPESGLLRTVSDGKGDQTKKRYNVAVSRARDQLWILHSMDIADLKEDDIRRGLLEYAKDPKAYLETLSSVKKNSDSVFEERVANELHAQGYNFEQQYQVGSYRIDIVVHCKDQKIAIECDGEKYHSTDEQIANDEKRQAALERAGWRFIRIRGSAYFSDPDAEMERVYQKLKQYDIVPENASIEDQSQKHNELLDRIKRRAQEYLDAWHRTDTAEATQQSIKE
jgi:helicase